MSSLSLSCSGVRTTDGGVNVEVVKALRGNLASLDVDVVGAPEVVGCSVDRDTAGPAGEVFGMLVLSWLRSRMILAGTSGLVLPDVEGVRVGLRVEVVDKASGVDGPLYLRS